MVCRKIGQTSHYCSHKTVENSKFSVGRLVGCQNSQFENILSGLGAAVAARNKVGMWVHYWQLPNFLSVCGHLKYFPTTALTKLSKIQSFLWVDWWVVKTLSRSQKKSWYVGTLVGNFPTFCLFAAS